MAIVTGTCSRHDGHKRCFELVAVLVRVCEDGDATHALEAELRTRAVVGRRHRDNRCINLDDSKYVIGLCESCGVLTSYIRHILEPRAGFRIDNAQRLHRWSAGVGSSYVEAAVA